MATLNQVFKGLEIIKKYQTAEDLEKNMVWGL